MMPHWNQPVSYDDDKNPLVSSVPLFEAVMASYTPTALLCETFKTFNYLIALRAVTKCNSSKHQPDTEIIMAGCFSESSQETQFEIPHHMSTMATSSSKKKQTQKTPRNHRTEESYQTKQLSYLE